MKISIKTQNIALTPEIEKLVAEKLAPLEKFTDGFGKDCSDSVCGKEKPGLEMRVDIGRDSLHHQKGKVFLAKAQIGFSKKIIIAEVRSENLESAIIELKDRLQQLFKKYKDTKIKSRT